MITNHVLDCSDLGEVIGSKKFAANKDIWKVIVTPNVKLIDRAAFLHCPNLKEVTFHCHDLIIGKFAFQSCAIEKLTFHCDHLDIREYAFSVLKHLKTLDLSDCNEIDTINNYTFMLCTNLRSIQLPQGLRIIKQGAFTNCSKLEDIAFPDSLIYIGDNAFNNTGLYEVTLPENIFFCSPSAFKNCHHLIHVNMPIAYILKK